MFALFVLVSRFLFVFLIIYFLFQGLLYVLGEREIISIDMRARIFNQRVTLILTHILAYAILSYTPDSNSFNLRTLAVGGLGLAFFILAWFLSKRVYKNSCNLLWNSVFFLLDIGLIMLQRIKPASAEKQLIWFVVGLFMALTIPFLLKLIPRFEMLELFYLLLGFVFIISPFVLGKMHLGAINRIDIGGFAFQPSEFVKFLFVFYLASVLRKKHTISSLIFPTLASVAFVAALVAQKDLGGALIFFMTFMSVLYIATGNVFLFASGFVAASGASVLAYRFFDHIQVRVAAWQNPFADIDTGGYQIVQSLFAIGTWGIWGSGLTRGTPNIIPIVESDFIFAAICEEFGGLFAISLIAVMLVVFYRGVHIALRSTRGFYSLLAAGFTCILAFQSFLILGGVIKLIPLTGVTLPLISYGGSSIIVSFLMIGILQWIFSYYSEENGYE